MMDMSSILDATLTFLGLVAVLMMGVWGLSSTSTTVSTTSKYPQNGPMARELREAA